MMEQLLQCIQGQDLVDDPALDALQTMTSDKVVFMQLLSKVSHFRVAYVGANLQTDQQGTNVRSHTNHVLSLSPKPILSVGVGRIFESVCLSVCLSVCPQHN